MNKIFFRKAEGFTLAEVMIAIGIIGVLAALALPRYRIQMLKIQNQEAIRILMALWDAQKDYARENNNNYTTVMADLDIDIPPPRNFAAPVLDDATTNISCGGPNQNYVASIVSHDGSYTLYALVDGRIVCTPCPGTLCQPMGFPAF